MVFQLLVAGLAVLLLLEAWLRRRDHGHPAPLDHGRADDVNLHPELIVPWDDEADYARRSACSRPNRPTMQATTRQPVGISQTDADTR
jgi:hypothetical protein